MKKLVQEKIYIIFNLAAQKAYVGRTRNLDSRYSDHVRQLRKGRHENPDLQRDWDRDGEENFIWVDVLLRAGEIEPNILEDLLIDTLRTLEPTLGYNRMTSRGWSEYAKVRDLERKLKRSQFTLIPGINLGDPIQEGYLKSVLKGHGRVKIEQPEEAEWEDEWEALEEEETAGEAQDLDKPADEESQPEEQ